MEPRLRLSHIEKSFGATRALQDVSLEVQEGEVHALIGENGAGKSTLMKILAGVIPPDKGDLHVGGKILRAQNPLEAHRAGIAMIHQELNLAPHLNAVENIMLGQERSRLGWLRRPEEKRATLQVLESLNHANIPLDVPVGTLGASEKQIIEIARALIARSSILILDEPTSSLTQADTEKLFAIIQRLKKAAVSIIYISHFLDECQRIADRFTVLRDGKTAGTGKLAEVSLADLVRLMAGREVREIYPKVPHAMGEPILETRNVRGEIRPRAVNLQLRRGEILGIAGLIGSGRTEMLRAIFGLDRLAGGEVRVGGKKIVAFTPRQSWQQKMGCVSENRKEEGLMLHRSIADNLTLTRFPAKLGLIDDSAQDRAVARWSERMSIRHAGSRQTVGELSGGNQQKVALARLLHHEAEIFLLDEPTRGIDIASKAQIYRLVGELAAGGKAILFVSSYLPELFGVCDTIAVMHRGTLSEARPASAWTEEEIIGRAAGAL